MNSIASKQSLPAPELRRRMEAFLEKTGSLNANQRIIVREFIKYIGTSTDIIDIIGLKMKFIGLLRESDEEWVKKIRPGLGGKKNVPSERQLEQMFRYVIHSVTVGHRSPQKEEVPPSKPPPLPVGPPQEKSEGSERPGSLMENLMRKHALSRRESELILKIAEKEGWIRP